MNYYLIKELERTVEEQTKKQLESKRGEYKDEYEMGNAYKRNCDKPVEELKNLVFGRD